MSKQLLLCIYMFDRFLKKLALSIYHLLNICRFYLHGGSPDCTSLYHNGTEFPASAAVPSLSSLIKWNHNESYPYKAYSSDEYFGEEVTYDLSSPKWLFLFDHNINNKPIFPGTAYIVYYEKL